MARLPAVSTCDRWTTEGGSVNWESPFMIGISVGLAIAIVLLVML